MSQSPSNSGSGFNPRSWIVPGAVVFTLAAAVVSYSRSPEIQAAAGSPYYSKAVQEALSGLQNPGEKQAAAVIPALPAGLSPADHYWCEQCKAYHKRQPVVQPAPGGGNAAATVPPAAPSTPAGSEAIPPLPAGLSPADYEWCVNCKTYHPRTNQQTPPGGAGEKQKK